MRRAVPAVSPAEGRPGDRPGSAWDSAARQARAGQHLPRAAAAFLAAAVTAVAVRVAC